MTAAELVAALRDLAGLYFNERNAMLTEAAAYIEKAAPIMEMVDFVDDSARKVLLSPRLPGKTHAKMLDALAAALGETA